MISLSWRENVWENSMESGSIRGRNWQAAESANLTEAPKAVIPCGLGWIPQDAEVLLVTSQILWWLVHIPHVYSVFLVSNGNNIFESNNFFCFLMPKITVVWLSLSKKITKIKTTWNDIFHVFATFVWSCSRSRNICCGGIWANFRRPKLESSRCTGVSFVGRTWKLKTCHSQRQNRYPTFVMKTSNT